MGGIGRSALKKELPKLKKKFNPDLIIANVENLAHGKGITRRTLQELKNSGVDFFTSGNHIYSKEEYKEIFNSSEFDIIAPLNDPRTPDNSGYKIINIGKQKITILNLLGQVFINEDNIESPFKTFDDFYKKNKGKSDFIFIDFHAEATSEKEALGYYVDGKASIILGTHTHVQTNDAKKLKNGTLYLTDAGMVGAEESVIGVDKDIIIDKFLTDSKITFDIPKSGIAKIDGVYIELNKNKKKNKINQFSITTKVKSS